MWNTAANPSMTLSNKGANASGVTSRPVRPVPPVEMTTSISGSLTQSLTVARISSTPS